MHSRRIYSRTDWRHHHAQAASGVNGVNAGTTVNTQDTVSAKVSDERFIIMSKKYEDEQKPLKIDMQVLQQEIEVQKRQIEDLDQFIQKR